jgi:hypothetical protein
MFRKARERKGWWNWQRKILVRQCINEADGCARREADGYLLSLPSYPLLFEKTRLIGNMFQVNLFVHDWD